ncbi:DUF2194 domain-containing protein [Tumebacillus sp. DT12]|uniref:DUF2194 domain-containing protein n=1 Tax=Tumebacillus lacus TaxID=2995335 RepID=A0ABT3WXE1_9BACL|nr:DUF2194 domain-containing protein [Tumebacillus lacus]MCX7568886.1 DUF2194 domain-containing protein [Tumebacillus lacus]
MKNVWRMTVYAVLLVVAVAAVGQRVNGWLSSSETKWSETGFEQVKEMQIPEGAHERYLLLFREGEEIPETAQTRDNVEMALRYARLPYDVLTFEQWQDQPVSLDRYNQGAVILIGEDQDALAHVETIQRYVTDAGGLLVNAVRSVDSPLNVFMGATSRNQFLNIRIKGLGWLEPLFPGLTEQGLSEERLSSSSLDPVLDPQAKVWAELIAPRKVPFLWTVQRGKGRTLYWNTTSLQSKVMRGPFLQAMTKAQGDGAARLTVGAQVWYIDDFPSPAYDRVTEGNKTGMTDYDFRLKQWDPDMQELAKKYGLRYSAGVIFSYSDRVQAPFELEKRQGHEKLFDFEAKLLQSGELGLHGYNHQSLKMEYTPLQQKVYGYNPWPSTGEMRGALEEASKLWDKEFGGQPTMYIPPSNVLSLEGKQVLADVFPGLRTISASYVTNPEEGAFEQEFLPDPDVPRLMGTPRLTYGYELTGDQRFELYAGVATLGIVSHFNHPDDVFNEERNMGKDWPALLSSFDQVVADVEARYPWLRKLTATELSDELRHYYAAEVRFDRSQPGKLTAYASPMHGPLYVEVRAQNPERWQVKSGGEIVGTDAKTGLLWVKMTDPMLSLEVTP